MTAQGTKLYAIRYTLYAILCVTCLATGYPAFADTVYMEDGSVMKGLVVEEHHDRVVFSTAQGEKAIFKKDIDEIFFDLLEQNYYYIANRFLSEGDFENAEKFYAKALGVNPDYRKIHKALSRLEEGREKEIKKWKAKDPLGTLREQMGISISIHSDFCRVNRIFDKDTLLNMGDTIVAVWDESMKFMGEEEVARRLIGIPDTSVIVTIRRNVKFRSRRVPWYLKIFGLQREETLPLRMESEGLVLGRMTQASLAAKLGLEAGDKVVAIDGVSTRYTPLAKARDLIDGATPKEVRLTIERDIELTRQK